MVSEILGVSGCAMETKSSSNEFYGSVEPLGTIHVVVVRASVTNCPEVHMHGDDSSTCMWSDCASRDSNLEILASVPA